MNMTVFCNVGNRFHSITIIIIILIIVIVFVEFLDKFRHSDNIRMDGSCS